MHSALKKVLDVEGCSKEQREECIVGLPKHFAENGWTSPSKNNSTRVLTDIMAEVENTPPRNRAGNSARATNSAGPRNLAASLEDAAAVGINPKAFRVEELKKNWKDGVDISRKCKEWKAEGSQ